MRSLQCKSWFAVCALLLASTGCCCVQGMPGSCGGNSCGGGGIAACRSCAGGCGEVYVDEWISEPPTADPAVHQAADPFPNPASSVG